MDNSDYSLNSVPTMVAAGGHRPQVFDEPSLGSAPTMAPSGGVNSPTKPHLGRIDQYELLRKLGGGGFGVVYLAYDTNSGVEVALKTLHPLLKSNAEEMDALRDKFALVSRLTHTNIAKALVLHPVQRVTITDESVRQELHLSPGDSVMVMDYAPGVTLSKWRRQFPGGTVPLPLAIEVGRQIASALDYAHGERIVHRDIKPSNLMVETLSQQLDSKADSGLRVRILDFGLAAEIRSSMSRVSTEKGDTSGTRPYMAPEQWQGRKQDGRTDQYALACVLYELISGAPPFASVFETADPVIMANAVENRPPEAIEGAPAAVNAALMRTLSKQPKNRFESCGELVAAIKGGASSPSEPPQPDSARPEVSPHLKSAQPFTHQSESNVLRRKLSFARKLKEIPEADRADAEYFKFIAVAEDEMAVAEEACRLGLLNAATESLGRVEVALEELHKAHIEREETERQAREEAEKKAREEAERKAREEVERKAREAAAIVERKARMKRLAAETPPGTVRTVEIYVGIKMDFCWCPATTSETWKTETGKDYFLMGSPDAEIGRFEDETQHSVILTKGFWIGKMPVTQKQWSDIMGQNPSSFKEDKYWTSFIGKMAPYNPVERVSWNDCMAFIKKLNDIRLKEENRMVFALPTEAQWEYACRASTIGAYCKTGRLDDMGWHIANSEGKTHPVAAKKPNDWGLYDVHGNVWEWCSDWYGEYPSNIVTDPKGPSSGQARVLRGGAWYEGSRYCRSANRSSRAVTDRYDYIGFRLALIPVE